MKVVKVLKGGGMGWWKGVNGVKSGVKWWNWVNRVVRWISIKTPLRYNCVHLGPLGGVRAKTLVSIFQETVSFCVIICPRSFFPTCILKLLAQVQAHLRHEKNHLFVVQNLKKKIHQ